MNIQKIIYTAVVLDRTEDILFYEEKRMMKTYKNVFLHHVTVQFGFNSTELPDYIGEYAEFSIADLRKDSSAMSFHGRFSCCSSGKAFQTLKEMVMHPHITIATAEGIKPVYAGTMPENTVINTFHDREVHGRIGAFVVFDDGTTGWVFEK